MLTMKNLTKEFGALVAVDDVSLTIEDGEVHSIIGPNGAGKTTLFNMVTGTLFPSSGRVYLHGEDVTDLPDYERARKGIGRSFQITKCFDDLTIYDNILAGVQKISGNTYAMHRLRDTDRGNEERVTEIVELLGLGDVVDMPAENLPHGQKRKLEMGISLGIDPDILLLDEPAAGLGEHEQGSIIQLVERVSEECTIVLVEHNVDIVMSVSDRISVLDQGRIIMTDEPKAVRESDQVKQAYLGTEL